MSFMTSQEMQIPTAPDLRWTAGGTFRMGSEDFYAGKAGPFAKEQIEDLEIVAPSPTDRESE